MRTGEHCQCGFAYVLLLVAIALLGIAASTSLSLGAAMSRRDAERQLLAVGSEFQQALRSYAGVPVAAASAPAASRGPQTLDDLLKDPRVGGTRRHLRQLYPDPLTGRAEWGVVKDPQGHILGVHSLAQGRPLQRSGFDPQFVALEEAESYAQWVFGLPVPGGMPR